MTCEEIDFEFNGNAYAGAFSYFGKLIGVGGFYGRFALVKYPELREIANVQLFKSSLHDIQISKEYVACLGDELEKSEHSPANFDTRLKVLAKDGLNLLREVRVKAGIWRMVKGGNSNLCILYDGTEEQGVVIYNASTGDKIWEIEGFSLRIAYIDGPLLIGHTYNDKLLVVELFKDYQERYIKLPETGKYCWTYAITYESDSFILGGYEKKSGQISIDVWNYKTGCLETVYSSGLESFYEKKFLDCFVDEEWTDLNHLSFMTIRSDRRTLFFTLGGEGVGNVLADTSSSVAVKYDIIEKKVLEWTLLDESEGCNGVVMVDENRLLCDCCSSLKLLTI